MTGSVVPIRVVVQVTDSLLGVVVISLDLTFGCSRSSNHDHEPNTNTQMSLTHNYTLHPPILIHTALPTQVLPRWQI